jgi:hypothetical protein
MKLDCAFSGEERNVKTHSSIIVSSRDDVDQLFQIITKAKETRLGDFYSLGKIAAAVQFGHKVA